MGLLLVNMKCCMCLALSGCDNGHMYQSVYQDAFHFQLLSVPKPHFKDEYLVKMLRGKYTIGQMYWHSSLFSREEREGHIKGKQARFVLFLAYPIICMFLTLKEHESEINILKTLPVILHIYFTEKEKRSRLKPAAHCVFPFFFWLSLVRLYDMTSVRLRVKAKADYCTSPLFCVRLYDTHLRASVTIDTVGWAINCVTFRQPHLHMKLKGYHANPSKPLR